MLQRERGHGVLVVGHRLLLAATGQQEKTKDKAEEAHASGYTMHEGRWRIKDERWRTEWRTALRAE
jgi:hypothetical protein